MAARPGRSPCSRPRPSSARPLPRQLGPPPQAASRCSAVSTQKPVAAVPGTGRGGSDGSPPGDTSDASQ